MAVWKVIPALAAGATVVIKPSELTPLTTLTLARLAKEAGLTDGALNVVTGWGADVGNALAGHRGVDMVTFTGSTATGRKVMAAAASHGRRVQLELGGKAPFVVFDDADLDAAVQGAVAGALINSGQDCTAATRAIVARNLYDDFVAGVAEVMGKVVVGDPADADTDLGPLISTAHRDKVAGIVARAPSEGACVVTGGTVPDGPGAFYPPTLLADVDERSEAYRDEIFGPVLTVRAHDGDDDALRQANDTEYGLAASAWTRDVYRAQRASREIKAGCVWINDHIPIISEMPHGGVGASGLRQGHERLLARGVPDHQARDERHHRCCRKALAPNGFQEPRLVLGELLAGLGVDGRLARRQVRQVGRDHRRHVAGVGQPERRDRRCGRFEDQVGAAPRQRAAVEERRRHHPPHHHQDRRRGSARRCRPPRRRRTRRS